jgi:hypothetical protein
LTELRPSSLTIFERLVGHEVLEASRAFE